MSRFVLIAKLTLSMKTLNSFKHRIGDPVASHTVNENDFHLPTEPWCCGRVCENFVKFNQDVDVSSLVIETHARREGS